MIATILLAPPAEQQLRAVEKPLRKALVKWLNAIKNHPRPPGVITLEGEDHLYRVRDGDYRIIYAIRDTNLIVLAIKHSVRTPVPRS